MAANSGRNMLPLQSLLNPASSGPSSPKLPQNNTFVDASPTESARTAASSAFTGNVPAGPTRGKAVGESLIQPKSKPRGPVLFPPFEDLGEDAVREVLKFRVSPFGRIHQEHHHIPYSSSKKDLFDKTGRESIEAFKYEFRAPGRETTFVVMWDYNIGIVRMNPFIKWGRFPKTKSSQLLDKNPGLRDISPGITGGAVLAQGYWVPYRCAKALFATFCFPIAGAMIPLFGPSFPSQCIPPEAPNYGTVTISPSLIAEVTLEVEHYRRYYLEIARFAKSSIHDHRHHDGTPSQYYSAVSPEAHYRYPMDRNPAGANPEHLGSGFMYHEAQMLGQQATAQPTNPAYNSLSMSHSTVFAHPQLEPYHAAAAFWRNHQATARNSELLVTNPQWLKRQGDSPNRVCRPEYSQSATLNQNPGRHQQQGMRPADEKYILSGEEHTILNTITHSGNSNQYTAAMALVMLSEDQRKPRGGRT